MVQSHSHLFTAFSWSSCYTSSPILPLNKYIKLKVKRCVESLLWRRRGREAQGAGFKIWRSQAQILHPATPFVLGSSELNPSAAVCK